MSHEDLTVRELTETELVAVQEAYREFLWELSRDDMRGLIEMVLETATTEQMVKGLSDDEAFVVEQLGFDPFVGGDHPWPADDE